MTPVGEVTEGPVVRLNALSREAAAEALARCCGAARWVEAMLARRPFSSRSALLGAAAEVWSELGPEEMREAFAHHPDIGANAEDLRKKFAATAEWARAEQGGAADASEATRLALRAGNQAYRGALRLLLHRLRDGQERRGNARFTRSAAR